MNKVLERQLKKVYGSLEEVPKELAPLLKLVSTTYDHNEEDRGLIERSLDLSSKELGGLNERLQSESDTLRKALNDAKRMNDLMVDRELRMIELKKEIVALKKEEGKPKSSP